MSETWADRIKWEREAALDKTDTPSPTKVAPPEVPQVTPPVDWEQALREMQVHSEQLPTDSEVRRLQDKLTRSYGFFPIWQKIKSEVPYYFGTPSPTDHIVLDEVGGFTTWGKNLRETQIDNLRALAERQHPDQKITPELIGQTLNELISAASQGPEYLRRLPVDHVMKEEDGSISREALSALQVYAMDDLAWEPQSDDELTNKFQEKWDERDEAGQAVLDLLRSAALDDRLDKDFPFVAGVFANRTKNQITSPIPNLSGPLAADAARVLHDEALSTLLRADLPAEELRAILAALQRDITDQHIKHVFPYGSRAEHYRLAINAYKATKDAPVRTLFIPMFEMADGTMAIDWNVLEDGLTDAIFTLSSAQRNFDTNKAIGTEGSFPDIATRDNLRNHARQLAKMRLAPHRTRGGALIAHKDAHDAHQQFDAATSRLGRVSRKLENLASIAWYTLAEPVALWKEKLGGERTFPSPQEIEANYYISRGDLDGFASLADIPSEITTGTPFGPGDLLDRAALMDIKRERGEQAGMYAQLWTWAVEDFIDNKRTFTPVANFIHNWMGSALLPSKQVAGVVQREGKPYRHVRDELFFEGLVTDESLLSYIGLGRKLDFLIRMVPSEVLATSYADAATRFKETNLQLTDAARRDWFIWEQTLSMANPRVLDRALRQEVDQGLLLLEAGDAYLDDLPYGDTIIIPGIHGPGLTLQQAVGAAGVGFIWGLEPDGLLGSTYTVAGGIEAGRAVRASVGRQQIIKQRAAYLSAIYSEYRQQLPRSVDELLAELDPVDPRRADTGAIKPDGRRFSDTVDAWRNMGPIGDRVEVPPAPRPWRPPEADPIRPLEEVIYAGMTTKTGDDEYWLMLEDFDAWLNMFEAAAKDDPTGVTKLVLDNAKHKAFVDVQMMADTDVKSFLRDLRAVSVELDETVRMNLIAAREAIADIAKAKTAEEIKLARAKAMEEVLEYHLSALESVNLEVSTAETLLRNHNLTSTRLETTINRFQAAHQAVSRYRAVLSPVEIQEIPRGRMVTPRNSVDPEYQIINEQVEVTAYNIGPGGDERFLDTKAKLKDGRTVRAVFNDLVESWVPSPSYMRVVAAQFGESVEEITRRGPNPREQQRLYAMAWRQWAEENPKLLKTLGSKALRHRGRIFSPKTPVIPTEARSLRIVSGGESGVEQYALEIATAMGLEVRGTAKSGYQTKEGRQAELLRDQYGLTEGSSRNQLVIAEENVKNSDGTILLGVDLESTYAKSVVTFGERHHRPVLINPSADEVAEFIQNKSSVNITGRAVASGDAPMFEPTKLRAILSDGFRPVPKVILWPADELATILRSGIYTSPPTRKAAERLLKILDDPALLDDALKLLDDTITAEDFISANKPILEAAGFELHKKNAKQFLAEALRTLAKQTPIEVYIRQKTKIQQKISLQEKLVEAAKARLKVYQETFRKNVADDLRAVTSQPAEIDIVWPRSRGDIPVRGDVAKFIGTLEEAIALAEGEIGIHKAVEESAIKWLESGRHADDWAEKMIHGLPSLRNSVNLDDIPLFAGVGKSFEVAARMMAAFVYHLDQNITSLRAYGHLSLEQRQVISDAFAGKGRVGATGSKSPDVKDALDTIKRSLDQDAARGPVPDPDVAAMTAQDLVAIWSSPVQPYHSMRNPLKLDAWFKFLAHPENGFPAWASWVSVEFKRLLETHPVFSRAPRMADPAIGKELDSIKRAATIRFQGLTAAIDLIYREIPDITEANKEMMRFLAFNEAVEGAPFKIPTTTHSARLWGREMPTWLLPWSQEYEILIPALSGLNRSLMEMAFDNIMHTRKERVRMRERLAAGVGGEQVAERLFLDDILYAQLEPRKGQVLPRDEVTRGLQQARDYFFETFSVRDLRNAGADNWTIFEAMINTIREGLRSATTKRGTATFVVVPDIGPAAVRANSRSIKALLKMVNQELITIELHQYITGGANSHMADAMNFYVREYSMGAIHEINAQRYGRRPERGMWFIPKESAEELAAIFRGPGQEYDITKPPGRRVRGVSDAELTEAKAVRRRQAIDAEYAEVQSEIMRLRDAANALRGKNRRPEIKELRQKIKLLTQKGKEIQARVDARDPKKPTQEPSPFYYETTPYREGERLEAEKMPRLPIHERIMAGDAARPARQLAAYDEERDMLRFVGDKTWYPRADWAPRDIRFALVDILDQISRWNFEAFAAPGRQKYVANEARLMRNEVMTMIVHSSPADGGTRAVPQALIFAPERRLDNIRKELYEPYSQSRGEGLMATFMRRHTAEYVIDRLHDIWRYIKLFGLAIPRYAYLGSQYVTEVFSQWFYAPSMKAVKLTGMAGLGFIPYVGNRWLMATLRKQRASGNPMHATVAGSFNPTYNKLWEATDEVAGVDELGKPITWGKVRGEAAKAGAWDHQLKPMMEEAAAQEVDAMLTGPHGAHWRELGATVKNELGIDFISDIKQQFHIAINRVQGDLRALSFAHYRLELGMSYDEAAAMMNKVHIDWRTSINDWEKKVLGRIFLFYTLHKNGLLMALDAVTELNTMPGRTLKERHLNYMAKYMTLGTRVQRVRMMSRFVSLPQYQEEIAGDVVLTPKEMRERAMRVEVGKFLRDRSMWGQSEMLSEEAQDKLFELSARKGTMAVHPTSPLGTYEYLADNIELAEVLLAVGVLVGNTFDPDGSVIPYAVDQKKLLREGVDRVSQYMTPTYEFMLKALVEAASEDRTARSMYGRKASQQVGQMMQDLERLGFTDNIGIITYRDPDTDEMRLEYTVDPFSWAAHEVFYPLPASELARLRSLLTVAFGTDLGEIGTTAELAAIATQGGEARARLEALLELSGLVKLSIVNPEQYKQYELYSKQKELEQALSKKQLEAEGARRRLEPMDGGK